MNIVKANLVLAAAAVVLAIPTWLTLRSERELFTDVAQVPRMFEGFTPDSVAAVLIGEPKPAATPPAPAAGTQADPNQKPQVEHDVIQFQRVESGFMLGQGSGDLTGAPANKELLDNHVFKHLAEIRADRQALVQQEATDEQLVEYGLDDAQAWVFKAVNGQNAVLAELLVGKDSSRGKYGTDVVRGVYVRRRDSRDVVLYEVPFFQKSVKTEFWLDKTLVKAPADKIRKITVRNPSSNGVAYEFTRPAGQGSWTCTNPPADKGALRQSEIELLAQRFGYTIVQDFKRAQQTANLKELGLQPPLIEVTVAWQDGDQEKTVTLGVGTKVDEKNERYLISSTNRFVMTWPEHFVTPFEKDMAELFDPKAPEPKKDEEQKQDPGKDADKDKKPGGG